MMKSARKVWSAKRTWTVATCGVLIVTTVGGAAFGGYSRPLTITKMSVKADGSRPLDPAAKNPVGPRQRASSITPDGRYVAFTSTASDLAPGDANAFSDVFVKDTKTGNVEIASVSIRGTTGTGTCGSATDEDFAPMVSSFAPLISANGRFVVFTSCATDLVRNDAPMSRDVFIRDLKRRTTRRISVTKRGETPNGDSGALPVLRRELGVAMTPDARYVAFTSTATDLVAGDSDGPPKGGDRRNVFLADLRKQKIVQVSKAADGGVPNGDSIGVAIDRDGQTIAFDSEATNLVEGVSVGGANVFLFNRKKRATTVISQPPASRDVDMLPADLSTGYSSLWSRSGQSMSFDGDIVFASSRDDLVPNDPNDHTDIFVYDEDTKRIERISLDSTASIETNWEHPVGGSSASISGNGRYVVWASVATNYVRHDGRHLINGACHLCDYDLFIYDRVAGSQEWVSRALDNLDGFGPRKDNPERQIKDTEDYVLNLNGAPVEAHRDSSWPAITPDGRFVSFYSESEKMVREPQGPEGLIYRGPNTYVADLGPRAGSGLGERPRPLTQGKDPLSDVPSSLADEGANLYSASLVERPGLRDLFVKIELEKLAAGAAGLVNRDAPGSQPLIYGLRFSVGEHDYEVRATSLLGGTFGLFECTAAPCTLVSSLKGGYGTTGDNVAASIPIDALPDYAAARVHDVEAFSARGTYLGGSFERLDDLEL